MLLALLGKAFSPKAGRIIVTALWGVFRIFYMGQVVYYAIFKVYFTLFSVGGAGQVAQFASVIFSTILQCWWALLLMLVGIMVSAVIISAATSAAVNKRSEKEQQQAYLAVSSAAELVRDDFQSITGRYKLVTTTVTNADGTTTTTKDTIEATCAGGDIINDIGERLMGAAPSNTYDKIYTFSIEGYEDVTANFLIASGTSTSGEDIYDLSLIHI